MPQKVLVTGSSGRIGRAIVDTLSQRYSVTGFDSVAAASTNAIGDIRDSVALGAALQGIDAVIHVAALHAPHVGVRSDDAFVAINVDATRHLLELAEAAGVRHVVYTSTTALYGAASSLTDQAAWLDESSEPLPKTIYHRTKLAAEQCLEKAAKAGRLQVTILRMSRCFPESAAVMAGYRLHRGIDARDVALGHRLALAPTQESCRRYILSGVTPFQRNDVNLLLTDAAKILALRAPELCASFASRGWPLPSRIDRVYDSSKAQLELGWRPQFGFQEILSQDDSGSAEVLASHSDKQIAFNRNFDAPISE